MENQKQNEKFTATLLVLQQLQPLYNTGSETQRSTIEMMIAAAIFYLPSGKKTYSGLISVNAANSLPKNRCKEHVYPRKLGATKLLTTDWNSFSDPLAEFKNMFYNEIGKYHIVTKEENTALRKYQKKEVFESWQVAYEKVGIVLRPA